MLDADFTFGLIPWNDLSDFEWNLTDNTDKQSIRC